MKKKTEIPKWVNELLPITFIIPGPPVVKKNNKRIIVNKRTGKPMIISSTQAIAWQDKAIGVLRRIWKDRDPIPAGILLNAMIVSYLDSSQRPDASNLYEAPQDALQEAGVISNDYWIVSHNGSRRKRDPEWPRVEITLSIIS